MTENKDKRELVLGVKGRGGAVAEAMEAIQKHLNSHDYQWEWLDKALNK